MKTQMPPGQEKDNQKTAVAALLRERNAFQEVLENAGALIAFLDFDLNFISLNSGFAKKLGYLPEQLVGKNYLALLPGIKFQILLKDSLEKGRIRKYRNKPFEFFNQNKKDRSLWDWTVSPVKDSAGKTCGLVIALVDVTQRKRAELKIHDTLKKCKRYASEVTVLFERFFLGVNLLGKRLMK
jgi:PAS domain S-box-containing protein